jgi:hypothetical protein
MPLMLKDDNRSQLSGSLKSVRPSVGGGLFRSVFLFDFPTGAVPYNSIIIPGMQFDAKRVMGARTSCGRFVSHSKSDRPRHEMKDL